MSRTEATKSEPIGLDIGTSRIVTARQVNNEIQYDTQLNAFVTIPYSKMTENMLQKEGVPHAVDGGEILVQGNESERFADLLNKDIRRTMTRGILNPDEPENVRLIRQITQLLVGKAEKGQKVCFTVPAAPLGAEENLTYHEATIRQILKELGFEPTSINEGLAVVYGELASSNYTGIGISCGGGLCNVCLAYLSVPIVSFSIPKAGDFIDTSAASVTGERPNRIRILKEQSFYMNGSSENKLHQVLNVYYEDMLQSLVAGLRNAFQSPRNLPKLSRPIPLVLSGGSAIPKGFRDRFQTVLNTSGFSIELSEIRTAEDPLTTTAKGALLAALAEM
jgi:hypothetical protein